MLRFWCCLVGLGLFLSACSDREKDAELIEFEKELERDAILVKTCAPDPLAASGPLAHRIRIYSFQDGFWYFDGWQYRQIGAELESVCSVLAVEK